MSRKSTVNRHPKDCKVQIRCISGKRVRISGLSVRPKKAAEAINDHHDLMRCQVLIERCDSFDASVMARPHA